MTPLFRLEAVTVEGRLATPLTFDLGAEGPTAIVGPSGSGKSTVLRLLNRLTVPTAGTVRFRGDDLAQIDPLAHRRRVAMVFQRPIALPGSVADNLRAADPGLDGAAIGRALDAVGLSADLAGREARDLSGGELQRVALARSLATEPEVVLFDEPTSALDEENAERIEQLALDLQARGIAVIWVSHDRAQVARLARRTIDLGEQA